jgi:hypothetical protein
MLSNNGIAMRACWMLGVELRHAARSQGATEGWPKVAAKFNQHQHSNFYSILRTVGGAMYWAMKPNTCLTCGIVIDNRQRLRDCRDRSSGENHSKSTVSFHLSGSLAALAVVGPRSAYRTQINRAPLVESTPVVRPPCPYTLRLRS